MKKMMLPLLVLVTALSACAQSSHLDNFYRRYDNGADGNDLFSGNAGFLFRASFSGNNENKDEDWMHKITAIRCLIIDGKNTAANREWAELGASLQADHFEEWFSARKGKSKFQLLSHDGKNSLEDVACLIIGDDGGGLFFHLRGHFTAEDKAKLEAALQSHDAE